MLSQICWGHSKSCAIFYRSRLPSAAAERISKSIKNIKPQLLRGWHHLGSPAPDPCMASPAAPVYAPGV